MVLVDNKQVQDYCQKSCGVCSSTSPSTTSTLTCSSLKATCNIGSCVQTVYFNIQSIRCVCPPNSGGAYCQRSNIYS